MKKIIIFLIKVYQFLTHNVLPKRCRFYPTCSHYAVEALEQKGLSKGLFLAFKRILRCSPFSAGGYDPIQ